MKKKMNQGLVMLMAILAVGMTACGGDDAGSGTGGGTAGGNTALVGTWLEIGVEYADVHYVEGQTFNADGTYYDYDDLIEDTSIAGIKAFIAKCQAEGLFGIWYVDANTLHMTEFDFETGKEKSYSVVYKYVISGNTLLLYHEYDKHGQDADGDGWEDEPTFIMSKYNL